MPSVTRVGDSLSTGHACVGTTTIASSNTDGTVHANSIDIIVIGAPTVSHPFPPVPVCAPHVANLNAGRQMYLLIVLQLVELVIVQTQAQ